MTYRTTKQEQLVLDIAQKHCDHPTADMLYLEVRNIDNHISRGTVYRNLEKLCETNRLLRIKVPGAADRFDGRLDLHYHFICLDCGNVFDAPIEYQKNIDTMVQETSGFNVIRHRTVFEGQCPSCARKYCNSNK